MTIKDKKYQHNMDLLGLIIKNWQVQSLTTDPATTYARVYYNSVSHSLRWYDPDSATWADFATTGSGLDSEAVQDIVGAMVVAGNNIDVTYDDSGGTLTIDVESLTSADITDFNEAARDALGAALVAGNNIDITVNDAGDTITIDVEVLTSADISDFAEAVDDRVAALIVAGNNIDVTYNDGAGTLTIDVEALTSADISDFDTQVRTSRLDQMAAPTADVSLNSHKITNLLDGSAASDAVTLGQAQSLVNVGTNKTAVRAASTANVTIATGLENGDTLDGVTLATGDRVLLKNQTTGSENGIYIVAASGAASRATDADISAEVKGGLSVWVNEGTVNADTRWTLTTNDPITLNTTALVFVQDFKASSTTAGAGLVLNGGALDVGQGTGITVNANDVAIDTTVVVRKFSATVGDGSTEDIAVTHNLGTRDITVNVWDAASPFSKQDVYAEATDTNNVTIFFATAPSTNQYRVVVHG